jgi:aspartyl-tRNA(Asn)/glutamyl-tRNA(Gln) amidotransferase subunit A
VSETAWPDLATLAATVAAEPTAATANVERSLDRITAGEEALNAILHIEPDGARRRSANVVASATDGGHTRPLLGVPVALKDNICTLGMATTCASRILDGWEPPYDATVVRRLEEAGAIVVAKTNLDEFAMGSSTEFSAFGPTANPYAADRVPGGSSGGSAAAVAAGYVPAALGSDTGGSVRQPAAYCGLVGVKPTYGLVSRYGLVAYGSSLDQVGPIATSVADAAVVLGVIAGHDPYDSTSIDQPLPDLGLAMTQPAAGLRVGIIEDTLGEGVQPEVAEAVRACAAALQADGATIQPVQISSVGPSLSAYYLLASAEASSNLSRFDGVRYGRREPGDTVEQMMTSTRTTGFGSEVKRRIILGTFVLSAGYQDRYYVAAQRVRTLLIQDFERAFASFDVLLSPTAPTTAFRIGEFSNDPLKLYLNDVCTVLANLAGVPAMSLPWGADTEGLPIGVQVTAPLLGEAALFRAGAAIERLAPTLPRPGARSD